MNVITPSAPSTTDETYDVGPEIEISPLSGLEKEVFVSADVALNAVKQEVDNVLHETPDIFSEADNLSLTIKALERDLLPDFSTESLIRSGAAKPHFEEKSVKSLEQTIETIFEQNSGSVRKEDIRANIAKLVQKGYTPRQLKYYAKQRGDPFHTVMCSTTDIDTGSLPMTVAPSGEPLKTTVALEVLNPSVVIPLLEKTSRIGDGMKIIIKNNDKPFRCPEFSDEDAELVMLGSEALLSRRIVPKLERTQNLDPNSEEGKLALDVLTKDLAQLRIIQSLGSQKNNEGELQRFNKIAVDTEHAILQTALKNSLDEAIRLESEEQLPASSMKLAELKPANSTVPEKIQQGLSSELNEAITAKALQLQIKLAIEGAFPIDEKSIITLANGETLTSNQAQQISEKRLDMLITYEQYTNAKARDSIQNGESYEIGVAPTAMDKLVDKFARNGEFDKLMFIASLRVDDVFQSRFSTEQTHQFNLANDKVLNTILNTLIKNGAKPDVLYRSIAASCKSRAAINGRETDSSKELRIVHESISKRFPSLFPTGYGELSTGDYPAVYNSIPGAPNMEPKVKQLWDSVREAITPPTQAATATEAKPQNTVIQKVSESAAHADELNKQPEMASATAQIDKIQQTLLDGDLLAKALKKTGFLGRGDSTMDQDMKTLKAIGLTLAPGNSFDDAKTPEALISAVKEAILPSPNDILENPDLSTLSSAELADLNSMLQNPLYAKFYRDETAKVVEEVQRLAVERRKIEELTNIALAEQARQDRIAAMTESAKKVKGIRVE